MLLANLPQYDRTPLHYAAGSHELACMVTLQEAGADINAAATNGDTPVASALAASGYQHPEVATNAIGILIAVGAWLP